jgi:predicted lipoprotein with Yx(FWY)xxD motif
MIRSRVAMLAALVAAGAAMLAACGTASGTAVPQSAATSQGTVSLASSVHFVTGTAAANNAPANTGDNFKGPSNSAAAMKWVQLTAGSAGNLNPVVLNGAGFVLYRFDKDTPHPSKSNCDGACAQKWPPVLVGQGSRIFVDGVESKDVGLVKRTDGTTQVTLHGWPLYKFSGDTKPGDTNGQGVGGTWFGITPDGTKAGQSAQGVDSTTGLDYKTGTAKQNNAPANTGDFYNGPSNSPAAMKWVQLTAGSAGNLNPVVVNGVGITLYRFDKDTPHPSKSNCNGACAVTWPPVLVTQGSRIFVNGVSTAQIGIVTRADGSRQVTLHGWPLYKYSGDKKPGDTNGEGIGGTWFGITPTGGKALPPGGVATTTAPAAPATPGTTITIPPAEGTTTLGGGTVTLFDDADFADNGSQQVSGAGCQPVVRVDVASSLKVDGGPVKIWTGPNCTGTSKVVSANIPDLSTVGFDNKIESVRFAG